MSEVPDVVCKVGAEGLHCAGVASAGLGVAVRSPTGPTGRPRRVARSLELLGALSSGQQQHLGGFVRPRCSAADDRWASWRPTSACTASGLEHPGFRGPRVRFLDAGNRFRTGPRTVPASPS